MKRTVITTDQAPAAIGPYSQAIQWGNTIFCAGQIPLDPSTGALMEGGVREQVGRIIKNLEAVLGEGGCGLKDILRLDVYLTDLSIFPEINDLLAQIFTEDPPARVTVEVSGLPMGAQIEMAAIAAK